jgi:hypothetical protein
MFLLNGAIKSHSCSLNPVITNFVTGPSEYEHFLHLQLMMETGPVLETLCLEELKSMDIFQNISYTSCNNVYSCKISCMQLVRNKAVLFKHDQQDAMLHNGIYYYKCSTCFRQFLCPSSGAQNCTHSIGYLLSCKYIVQ